MHIYSVVIDVKHIEQDLLCDPRNTLWGGTWGVGRGQKLSFSQHGHVAYQIEGNDELNNIQVEFWPKRHMSALGRGQNVKGQNIEI